ncbi:MAG: KPN_02809 family neutral zinc metallopeptidase [Alphaproteobacteria bacterium]
MRWRMGRRSENVEDRRGSGMGGGFGGGGMRVSRGGLGGMGLVVVVVLALLFGVDPTLLLTELGGPTQVAPEQRQGQTGQPGQPTGQSDEMSQFVSVVLADTEDTWRDIFRNGNKEYRLPKLVLFSGAVQSACGFAQAAVGPFYCPGDQKVYIDLNFFRDLRSRFGAPGDFAQAYVIAHEVGHHVQTLLGISQQVISMRQRVSEAEGNALSVRQELQADCFAGVWAHHADKARQILEQGDVEEALNAASAIGDDRLQKQAQGHITPESFTHGSSEQRVRWFRTGLDKGVMQACDTFSAARL